MGTYEGIGELRKRLKDAILVKKTITEARTTRTVTERLSLAAAIASANDQTLRDDANKLAAAFDRAAWTFVGLTHNKPIIRHFLNEFGDVWLDFWAICFDATCDQQIERGDDDNRLYFEYLTRHSRNQR